MYTSCLVTDEEMRELKQHGSSGYPIQFYVDELYRFPDQTLPLHWHPEPELWVAEGGDVLAQVGSDTFRLKEGCAIFVNTNVLHGFRQAAPDARLQCPNIVFSPELIAPAASLIYQDYILPVLTDHRIPCMILERQRGWQGELLGHLDHMFSLFQEDNTPCPEMAVQRTLNQIWQILYLHREEVPLLSSPEHQHLLQIRTQKMLSFIHNSYHLPISLADIARSAGISKSEASRCFQACLHTSPVSYLLSFRIRMARHALSTGQGTTEQISAACGFQSASYFCRMFRRYTGMSPRQYRNQSG